MECCKPTKTMKTVDDLAPLFDGLDDLTPLQRASLKERYRFLLSEYSRRCALYAVLFYILRITMTVGSLAVPALLTIQNTPGSPTYAYWITWGISLAVTTSNGILTLFKIDKRFFMLHATMERLRSETWQYIQLAGRYSGLHHHNHTPTHANQFVYYCSQLEKINMKRVDEEYIKVTDESNHGPKNPSAAAAGGRPDVLVPSPPEQPAKTPESRDSISLVEDDDDSSKKDQVIAIDMPLFRSQAPSVPKQGNRGVAVLPPTQESL